MAKARYCPYTSMLLLREDDSFRRRTWINNCKPGSPPYVSLPYSSHYWLLIHCAIRRTPCCWHPAAHTPAQACHYRLTLSLCIAPVATSEMLKHKNDMNAFFRALR